MIGMIRFTPQITLGGFALITLLLAGAAIGRVLGMSFGDALYLTVLVPVVLVWAGHRVMQRSACRSCHDNDEG